MIQTYIDAWECGGVLLVVRCAIIRVEVSVLGWCTVSRPRSVVKQASFDSTRCPEASLVILVPWPDTKPEVEAVVKEVEDVEDVEGGRGGREGRGRYMHHRQRQLYLSIYLYRGMQYTISSF